MAMPRFLLSSPVLLFHLASLFSKSAANCYFPNGTDVNAHLSTDVYQPCNAGDDVSMCCALNRPYPDKCRSDGLCFSTYDLNIWRDSCTDRSWQSSSCVKLCESGTGQYFEGVKIQLATIESTVTHCSDGSFCCGNGTIANQCCQDKKGVFIVNGETTHTNPNLSSSSFSSRTTITSPTPSRTSSSLSTFPPSSTPALAYISTSPSPSSSPTPIPSSKTGPIVGGILGGIAILILAIGLTVFLRRRVPPPAPLPELEFTDQPHKSAHSAVYHEVAAGPGVFHEVGGANGGAELDARPWREMEGGRVGHELQ